MRIWIVAIVALVALGGAACGGDSSGSAQAQKEQNRKVFLGGAAMVPGADQRGAAASLRVVDPTGTAGRTVTTPVAPLPPPVAAAPAPRPTPIAAAPANPTPSNAPRAVLVPRSPPRQPELPASPAGARFTIYCDAYTGPNHAMRASQAKNQLMAASGMKEWYTVASEDHTTLYYGFYRWIEPQSNERDSRKEAQRAKADREKIAAMKQGETPMFRSPLLVELDTADPTAPAEWNLANARGYWSVQVAAFKDSPERKQAAVETVKAARQQGIEAYYFHGTAVSSVCIGAWPESAVKKQRDPRTEPGYEDQTLIVTDGSVPVPSNLRSVDGKAVKVMQPVVEIEDPSLKKTLEAYPRHALNGMEIPRRVKGRDGVVHDVFDPSFLVEIPQSQPQVVAPVPDVQMPANLINPQPRQGEGRLRSIGE